MPLDAVLREALLALPNQGPRIFRFVAKNGREIGENSVGQRVVALAAQAGVKLTMHSLRKGFGCRYAGRVPAQVLQRLMRHSDIKTTMDYYANVDEAVREAILGPRRIVSRDNEPIPSPEPKAELDTTTCQERRNA